MAAQQSAQDGFFAESDRAPVAHSFQVVLTGGGDTEAAGTLTVYSSLASQTDGNSADSRTYYRSQAWTGAIKTSEPVSVGSLAFGEYLMVIRVPGYMVIAAEEDINATTMVLSYTLVATEGIGCFVVTEQGQPIEGAEVRMMPSNKSGVVNESDGEAGANLTEPEIQLSNSDGYAYFTSPSAPLARLHVVPPAPFCELILWDVAPGSVLKAVLVQGASVTGHVVDDKGHPVPGFNVAAYIRESAGAEVPIGSTLSDSGGQYRLELLDPRPECWILFAEKSGWEMRRSLVDSPVPGRLYTQDFIVRAARAGKYRLITLAGQPVGGLGIHLTGSGISEVPFSWTTDTSGFFNTGAHLLHGSRYSIQCIVGGVIQTIGQLNTPAEDEGQFEGDIVAQNIGRLLMNKAPDMERLDEIEVELAETVPSMIVRWTPPYSPLWLPAGEYLLTAFQAGALAGQQRVRIVPQEDTECRVEVKSGVLKFSVLPEHGELYVSVLTQSNIVVWEATGVTGEQSIALPVGSYYFSCYDSIVGAWDTACFAITSDGYSYGRLDSRAVCSAAIFGSVVTKMGDPVASALLTVSSSDGYRSVKYFTQADGAFFFSGLPLGRYDINCDLHQGTGLDVPIVKQGVLLTAGESRYGVTITISRTAGVRVKVPSAAALAQNGFLIDLPNMQFPRINAEGIFHVQPQTSAALVGVCYSESPGRVQILAHRTTKGDEMIDLREELGNARSNTFTLTDDIARNIRAIKIEYLGLTIGHANFGRTGQLAVLCPPVEGLEIVIEWNTGALQRINLTGVGHTAIVEPKQAASGHFNVIQEDSDGSTKCSVYIDCCDLRLEVFDGDPIYTRCDRGAHEVLIDAPGYMSVSASIADGSIVTLVRSAALERVDLSELPARASLLKILNYPEGTTVLAVPVDSRNIAQIAELPVGTFKFIAVGSSGEELRAQTIALSSTEPKEIRL